MVLPMFIIGLLVGAITGYIATVLWERQRTTMPLNLVVGVVGAWIAGGIWVLLNVTIASMTLNLAIMAVLEIAGALVLFFIVRLALPNRRPSGGTD